MLRNILIVMVIGLAGAVHAQGRDLSAAAQEMFDRMPPDQREDFVQHYAFDLTVPVAVQDFAEDVFAFSISCELFSAFATDPETLVARGRTLVIDSDSPVVSSASFERTNSRSHWHFSEQLTMSDSIKVPMVTLDDAKIEGWTHGTCDLYIHTWQGNSGAFDDRAQLDPTICEYGSVSDISTFSACAAPGSAFNITVPFGRLGYDNSGRPLE